MCNVWWKIELNWKRRTKFIHFESLAFCQIEPPFNWTFKHRTKTATDGSMKLCKIVENKCRYTQKTCQVINQCIYWNSVESYTNYTIVLEYNHFRICGKNFFNLTEIWVCGGKNSSFATVFSLLNYIYTNDQWILENLKLWGSKFIEMDHLSMKLQVRSGPVYLRQEFL